MRTYIAYAVGEIVLIMVGILLALQIGNWNASKAEQREVTEYLGSLREDFKENLEDIELKIQLVSEVLENVTRLREKLSKDQIEIDLETFNKYFAQSMAIYTCNPTTKTYDELISVGALRKINNRKLKNSLGEWKKQLDWLERLEGDALRIRDNAVIPYLIEHSALGDAATQLGDALVNYDRIKKGKFRTDIEELANDRGIDNVLVLQLIGHNELESEFQTTRILILEVNRLLEEALSN
jgi:hypothetical protein